MGVIMYMSARVRVRAFMGVLARCTSQYAAHICGRCSGQDIFCGPVASQAFGLEAATWAAHARCRLYAGFLRLYAAFLWYGRETLQTKT